MTVKRIVSVASAARSVEGLTLTDVRLIDALEAAAAGDAILVPYDPCLLARLPRDCDLMVTVLDILEIARGLEQSGILRYGWRRSWTLGPLTLGRLVPTEARLCPRALRSGIAGVGLMLAAAELRHAADYGVAAATLHWQLSDFLIANNEYEWLSVFFALARRYGLRVGICSNDVGRALQLADELHGLDFVIAPLSAAGFRMTPDRSTCEVAIRRRRVEVLPHLGSLRALDQEDRAYAERLGLTRLVVDA